MSEGKAFLEKVHIKNFLSLRNVELPFKPLTVLVGPNASGKSNVFRALSLFMEMINAERLPRNDIIQSSIWAGGANHLTFQLHTIVEEISTLYELEIKTETEDITINEELHVNGVKVISIQNGQGEVWDENGKNNTSYTATVQKIAIGSAGDYGKKPVTSALTEYFTKWNFYDFQPELMRGYYPSTPFGFDPEDISDQFFRLGKFPQINEDGSNLCAILSYLHSNIQNIFYKVSESLFESTKLKIGYSRIDGQPQLSVLEGYKRPIPLRKASDGTLRLIAYYTLLNQSELPPLIAIEEPEQSLHPAALKEIASVLELLAERTQVIITTHSSQLLDVFNPNNLSDSLGVLLLHNRSGLGTEVLNLEEIKDKREALDGWIADFGIGSAIFDSELLQDLMEEPT
ncbi:MAG: AAA family ATPase [Candidatus Poribacteria bacterium]|nr:AAA family ATPase [Candidatus Poribacteria bacterium]